MASEGERLFEEPPMFRQRLDECMSIADGNYLAKAFEEVVSTSWDLFGQFHLNISPGTVENIREERGRMAQINRLIDTWREKQGERATLRNMITALENGKLFGTKDRWWNHYRGNDDQNAFNERVEKLNRFIGKLAVDPISENEWSEFLIHLDIKQFQNRINNEQEHEKIRQRINIIFVWVEKHGYRRATITALHEALKAVKLRRVICNISGLAGNRMSMTEQFVHLLEDEWDHIFSKLNPEQKENILNKIKPPDHVEIPSVDDTFNMVLTQGNDGFHKFAKALSDEFKGDFADVFNNYKYCKLFELKKCHPPASHFQDTEAYKTMKSTLEEKRFLELHGLPGSGKSQCASKFAAEFMEKHPMSIVWFLDCSDDQRIDDSLLSLRNILLDNQVCTNNKCRDRIWKDMCSEIRKADIYVFLVFEDLRSKIKIRDKLSLLVEGFKFFPKAFVLATPRKSGLTPSELFVQQKLTGFTNEEALDYMLPVGSNPSDAVKKAAKEIMGRYSNLPLGIAPAKAYCDEKHLSYVDYLEVLDVEMGGMQDLEAFQDEWINVSDSGDARVGKNIFATMIVALQNMEQSTLSNQTIDYHEVFSHAMYFHHEKIPVYLFRQIIVQPNLLSEETHVPVSNLLCKIAINDLLKQLKQSSLGVVDFNNKDVFASTVSTHRVVLEALKHIAKRRSIVEPQRSDPKLLSALHALTCYSQKDNRLSYQHNLLRMLMPHISAALSMVHLGGEKRKDAAMLEKILYIKLLELKGFACTQTDAISEADEPLRQGYEQLIKLLCEAAGITEEQLDKQVEERALEGNGNDTLVKLKAKLLTQHCQSIVMKIPKAVFNHLAQTVVVNDEDIEILKRNAPDGKLHEKIVKNQPLLSEGLEWLRSKDLALPEEKFQTTFLAELLASIAYTRGRLMFYKEFDGDKPEHINYLKLSYYITKEVYTNTGIRLLHYLLSQTNGLLYHQMNEAKSAEEYQDIYRKYREYLKPNKQYFEHGILKEDGLTDYNQMRSYKQMILANHRQMELPNAIKDDSRFEVCRQLKQLVHKNPQYAKTAMNGLITAGRFCQFGERYQLAMEMYREMMDRLNNNEEQDARNFIVATRGFADSASKLFENDPSLENRANLKEAKQRCEKATVLLPRIHEQVEDITKLAEKLGQVLKDTEPTQD